MQETVVITGAAGFIGPKVVRLALERGLRVVAIDKLTYAAAGHTVGKPLSLLMEIEAAESKDPAVWERFEFVRIDVCDPCLGEVLDAAGASYLLHLAAESHVDRSIGGTPQFVQTEINGTRNVLEWIRRRGLGRQRGSFKKAVFVSTDETYGSIDRNSGREEEWLGRNDGSVRELLKEYAFTESTSLAGGSPYAATKAGADLLILSYFNTFAWSETSETRRDPSMFPATITRGCNAMGPYQHPEKLIPMAICTLLDPEVDGYCRRIPVYAAGLSSREWQTTEEYSSAILYAMDKGAAGEVYNVGSEKRARNRDILLSIVRAARRLELIKVAEEDLDQVFFDAQGARPGHDLAYAVNSSKLRGIGWAPAKSRPMETQIEEIVKWYADHPDWWQPIWRGQTTYEGKSFTDFWNAKYRSGNTKPNWPYRFWNDDHLKGPLDDWLL